MTSRMYQPDKSSKAYLYVVFFTAVFIMIGVYYNVQHIKVENQCSEMALKTSGLTKSFKYDPYSSYDYVKAKCTSEVLSATN